MDKRKKLIAKLSSASSDEEDGTPSKLFANLQALNRKRKIEEKQRYKEAITKYRESRNSYMDS